ncbi:2-hydroxychromene-2-carboxylate isomerase [Derxia lacustris]|uniref:2-hydroxychromene-2-carboxylate isomerase n=1 Tax=Derxia lacustris TaxID=764842 RepID=UPI000A177296|nr:2-hydroxychromene-2-carboxylate isomerase [Derxia lacustris]
MTASIDFYFDFSSPYGYFAAQGIDALAARFGRGVDWHPVLLGAIFKTTGARPLAEVPYKGDYSRHDWARIARLTGIPFRLPALFPISAANPSRAFLWLARRDEGGARRFALALYAAYFAAGRNIGEAEVVAAVAAEQGLDAAGIAAAMTDPTVKDELRHVVGQAEARGVFGSPYFVVDGEPFWGWDRLGMLETWLERGGF